MSEKLDISMRFTQSMVMHPESSVFVMCGCGQSFGPYFGVDANEQARAFMDSHPCRFKPAASPQGDGAGV